MEFACDGLARQLPFDRNGHIGWSGVLGLQRRVNARKNAQA